ncbi:hypothetical protein BU26DRAFT_94495 [Trematosphaeria pertusa]|uniref:Peptidase A2 domain-containing protein n=1 Tax=Trematosphaeria pertusa TaxID=390896 RepID=A0A6A6I0Z9_9PLEO|nr:uncharacterized protein BU26DRAFT_94495 [Trematosphaeria pertusa]KAF2244125.1 hypothetical protein BU26DRAFT_94495 [Trematosphaeria pertusa]
MLDISQPNGLRKLIPARAKLDTGCDVNLISEDFLRREGVKDDEVKILEEERKLRSFENTRYAFNRVVTLSFYLDSKKKIEEFYVKRDDIFDIFEVILGNEFIAELLVGKKSWRAPEPDLALILSRAWKSKGK